MEDKVEIFGEVKFIHPSNEYGFLRSEAGDFYFKLKDAQNKIGENDPVRFVRNQEAGLQWATCIRKVYKNRHGQLFVPRINSTHLHDGIEACLPEVIDRLEYVDGLKIVRQVDFPFVIGESTCVPTEETDHVAYAIRKGRVGHSRIVFGKNPVPCSSVTIVLLKGESFFVILSCYVGKKSAVEPYDIEADENALEFWKRHALIAKSEDLLDGSEVSICPWILRCPSISRYPRPVFQTISNSL